METHALNKSSQTYNLEPISWNFSMEPENEELLPTVNYKSYFKEKYLRQLHQKTIV